MPAYIGHTIMARDVYKKIDNKNVSRDYMITFSLGADLSKYSKCRRDTHNRLQNEFIYNMCDYMKENNLTKDPECLGVLYGHICHLMMDSTIHPLIWYVDEKCAKNKRNHTMIEMYYDNYLSLKHYDLRLDHHKNKEEPAPDYTGKALFLYSPLFQSPSPLSERYAENEQLPNILIFIPRMHFKRCLTLS